MDDRKNFVNKISSTLLPIFYQPIINSKEIFFLSYLTFYRIIDEEYNSSTFLNYKPAIDRRRGPTSKRLIGDGTNVTNVC